MLKLNKKVLGLSLSLVALSFSQGACAEGDVIGSASTVSTNKAITNPVNMQDRYIVAKINFYQDSLKVDQLKEAAEQGDVIAQHELGDIYRNGQGVTKSDVVALMWYMISEENGAKGAGNDKDFTARYMAGDQIDLAFRMAERWQKTHSD